MNAYIFTDEYRVKVERNCDRHTPYGDYVLKVDNDNIRIFTSNGQLPTKFSYPIKDIYRAKYKTTGTMQSCVVISINNILSKYVRGCHCMHMISLCVALHHC